MSPPTTRRELFTRLRSRLLQAEPEAPPTTPQQLLPPFLRPPGAADETTFLQRCSRGGACAEACPHDVILPLGPAYGEAQDTPAILPGDAPCRLCDGLPCARACQSGALTLLPIADVRMGTARLDPDRCWAALGQPCDYCLHECPLGERALRWNGDRPEVQPDGCTGCGLCLHICTATPPAIRIEPR
jgi:ferredoxin-type protein NapG